MLPDPLHTAVVHLPMALAVLLPGLAVLSLALIYKGVIPSRCWALLVLLQAILVGSGWLGLETGEDEEDRVERVVAERFIEAHEEAAERFMWIAGLGLLACGAGLLPGRSGNWGRVAGTIAAFGVLAAGVSVGHAGGELVYKHGAANAYIDAAGAEARRGGLDDD